MIYRQVIYHGAMDDIHSKLLYGCLETLVLAVLAKTEAGDSQYRLSRPPTVSGTLAGEKQHIRLDMTTSNDYIAIHHGGGL